MENEQQTHEETTVDNTEVTSSVTVDIGGGVSIELTKEDADKFIQFRDNDKRSRQELQTNYEIATKSVKELNEKIKFTETNSEEKFNSLKEEITNSLKSEYEGKINELNDQLLDQSIVNVINSTDNIVSDETARKDLVSLFKAQVKDDASDLSAKFQEFVKAKPYFIATEQSQARPPVQRSKVTSPVPQESASELLRKIIKV